MFNHQHIVLLNPQSNENYVSHIFYFLRQESLSLQGKIKHGNVFIILIINRLSRLDLLAHILYINF